MDNRAANDLLVSSSVRSDISSGFGYDEGRIRCHPKRAHEQPTFSPSAVSGLLVLTNYTLETFTAAATGPEGRYCDVVQRVGVFQSSTNNILHTTVPVHHRCIVFNSFYISFWMK